MGLPPGLETPRQVKHFYEQRYNNLIETGEYVPFLYPWATIGAFVVLVYLLFDHRKSSLLWSLRFPVFGFLFMFSAWSILNIKARSPPAAYGVGLISAWGTLWVASIMFFNDCQTDFRRIERADSGALKKVQDKSTNGFPTKRPTERNVSQRIRDCEASELIATQSPWQRDGPIFWQSYPSRPFIERLEWVTDVFTNFRGVGWSFQTTGIPPPPKEIELELNGHDSLDRPNSTTTSETTTSFTGIRTIHSRDLLLKKLLIHRTLGYLALDIIKTLMHHDAYFWGYMDAPPPSFLPTLITTSSILTRCYRLLLSLAGITTALNEIFHLGPLFFACLLGPTSLGLRGQTFLNPLDFWGSFSLVAEKGLAGWWGRFWHQTFRFAFEAPSTRLLQYLNIDKKSQQGKIISLAIAFGLSGCLHACGSFTQLGDTRPIMGPFRFFILQGVGVLLQMFLRGQLIQAGIVTNVPRLLCQATNVAFVGIWMYWTAPLLVDDFAKGGVWLYEPVAFSLIRALGFGAKDDTSWDLWYGLIFWRTGEHWWDTGIAF